MLTNIFKLKSELELLDGDISYIYSRYKIYPHTNTYIINRKSYIV